jgi:predicted RNA binding protein YcfA (HicA-like mRNA interferase family)
MANFYRRLIDLLREAGYKFKRPGSGDHEIWWNPQTRQRVTVDHGVNSRNTANAILKQAGLPKAF